MSERNYLIMARATGRYGTGSKTIELGPAIGYKQYISSLNNSGKYTPGVYRCNPVTLIKTKVTSVPGVIPAQTVPGYPYPVDLEGDLIALCLCQNVGNANSNIAPTWNESLAQAAINKTYTKIMSNDLEVGVMLAELRETVEGLRNPLAALRKSFDFYNRNLKKWDTLAELIESDTLGYFKKKRVNLSIDRVRDRLKRGSLPASAKGIAGTWLEWRYGIRPLISDIQAILDFVKGKSFSFSEKLQKRRSKSELVKNDSGTWSSSLIVPTVTAQWMRSITTTTTASVAFRYDAPLTLQERWGVDLFSIPGIAWELVPLSFVADWFLSVGQFLSALRVLTAKVTLAGISVSQRDKITVDGFLLSAKAFNTPLSISAGGSYSFERNVLQRRCINPSFSVVTPALNLKDLGLQRTLDAISLIYQRLPRLK